MSALNDAQKSAVLHHAGPLLVFAGAGSGKTRVITYRIAALLADHGVAPYRILAVTFTNKAAREMKDRLEAIAGPAFTDELWVGTFHSMCVRLLRRYHDEVGLQRSFVIYDDTDQKALVNRIVKEGHYDDRDYAPKLVLGRIHRQKQQGIRPRQVEQSHSFDATMVELYEKYERALLTANAVDFDDLILRVLDIAEDPHSRAGAELRSRFSHVLVDEFQDTNEVQYRLVRALAAQTKNLCVVGDDDQSIYSWRGADVRNIRGFRKDFPDALVVKLEQNYRSTGNIVSAALGVIEPSRDRVPKALWTKEEPGAPVAIIAVRDERDEARKIVALVQQELAEGVSAGDLAVFYRIHALSRVIEEALRQANISYQIIGGMKFFDRAEVKDLISYLRLIENPRSDADLMRIINTPTRGIGKQTVNTLAELATERGTSLYDAILPALEQSRLGAAAKKKLGLFRKLIDTLRDAAPSLLPHELAQQVLDDTGYRRLLQKEDTAEADARLENLQELVGSVIEFERDEAAAGQPATLSGYLERIALVADVDAIGDSPPVLLMTVHGAKGLEFHSVILTGMEEETFPYRGLDSDSPEELDEERRLAYVAITRARRRLFITHAGVRTLFGQTRYLAPSRFLADLPEASIAKSGVNWGSAPQRRAHAPHPEFTSRYGTDEFDQRRHTAEDHDPGEAHVDYDAFDDVPAEEAVELRRGAAVYHKRFGKGVVESLEQGDRPRVVARFPGFGTRKIDAAFLRFE